LLHKQTNKQTTIDSIPFHIQGASQDGSAMIAYNADDAALYGVLYHYPATQNNHKDQVVEIYDWDTGVSVNEKKA
jgi:hypothetical protein